MDGVWEIDQDYKWLCGEIPCPKGLYCGKSSDFGVEYDRYGSLEDNAFNFGYTTFDNIFDATLTVFQSITGEGWSKIIYILWH